MGHRNRAKLIYTSSPQLWSSCFAVSTRNTDYWLERSYSMCLAICISDGNQFTRMSSRSQWMCERSGFR
ncbi:hypothetical protein AHF37_10411 [Paragonimus kellicotti]|nr:hypothetical protein AHF37_10411 [Paragonimus kellicotti]